MRLYDFLEHARRRDARRAEAMAAEAVVDAVARIDAPDSVRELKRRVDGWFVLHRTVLDQEARTA